MRRGSVAISDDVVIGVAVTIVIHLLGMEMQMGMGMGAVVLDWLDTYTLSCTRALFKFVNQAQCYAGALF